MQDFSEKLIKIAGSTVLRFTCASAINVMRCGQDHGNAVQQQVDHLRQTVKFGIVNSGPMYCEAVLEPSFAQ